MLRDVYLAGIGSALPPMESVDAAVAAGRYKAELAARTQQVSVTVAPDGTESPDLAVDAARLALRRAGGNPAQVAMLLHGMLAPPVAMWHGAGYIHRQLGLPAGGCAATDLDAGCATALIGLETASAYLRTRDEDELAVVTAADCWRLPMVDRWHTAACPFGDGGVAVVLSSRGGFARIAGAASLSEPFLEPINRGYDPFTADGAGHTRPIVLRERGGRGDDKVAQWSAVVKAVQGVVSEAVRRSGIDMSQIDHFVCPFIGYEQIAKQFLEPLSLDMSAVPWEFARRVGHIGAADPLVGLDHLVHTERVSWRYILVLGAGLGGIFNAMVIENPEA
ncbi:ketoacyl-ACP synthase III family protein [Plantactinospora sp. WMMC1484]|uniref:ketoacyl-ACP synthase III family protein n=1 Tax=Plantactinospora sp. WMMC1484 TaxID=3404122 RepID=UPI003BF5490F